MNRILFLLPLPPRLDATHGGSRVMAQLITRLASRHTIALLYLRAADEPPLDETLQAQCAWTEEIARPVVVRTNARRLHLIRSLLRGRPMWATDWYIPAFARRVRELAAEWQPSIVQAEFQVMGQYLSALGNYPASRLLTVHEPGTVAARNLQNSQHGWLRLLHFFDRLAWDAFEPAVLRQAHRVVVFTERDRQELAPLAGTTPIIPIPLGTTIPHQPLDPLGQSPPSLLFFGSFRHYPNVDAALRLATAIFPSLQAQFPDLCLYIIGEMAPPSVKAVANDHIFVTGRVAEVTPYLDQAAVVVVPLRHGGGMRVKVLETLAAGKALVASPLALEGLGTTNGQQAIFAESDTEFIQAIAHLLAHPHQRAALAARARHWAVTNLNWDHSICHYEQLYQSLLPTPGAP
jgi:glycosyltransferase involved in cell wall biosynthesis